MLSGALRCSRLMMYLALALALAEGVVLEWGWLGELRAMVWIRHNNGERKM